MLKREGFGSFTMLYPPLEQKSYGMGPGLQKKRFRGSHQVVWIPRGICAATSPHVEEQGKFPEEGSKSSLCKKKELPRV